MRFVRVWMNKNEKEKKLTAIAGKNSYSLGEKRSRKEWVFEREMSLKSKVDNKLDTHIIQKYMKKAEIFFRCVLHCCC